MRVVFQKLPYWAYFGGRWGTRLVSTQEIKAGPIIHRISESASQALVGSTHEPSTVYVNPMCLQMDQLILKAETPEEVLTLLVTHRGVLFLHNLITSLSTLAQMSSESVPFEKSKELKFPDEFQKATHDRLLSDPRYMVLVNDLIEGSSKLDLQAIETILRDLRTLDHCHYKLFGALLRRLYNIELTAENLALAISVGQTLDWGGFGRAETFFKRLSALIISEAPTMDRRTLLNALVLFSKLPTFHVEVMDSACISLSRTLPSLNGRHLGISAVAISEYGPSIPSAQRTLRLLADSMLENMDRAELRDVVRVAVGLRRVNVEHPELLNSAWNLAVSELKQSLALKERMDPSIASISDLATLVDACAHFGLCKPLDVSKYIIPYIADHLDLVTEEAAVKLLFGLASSPSAVTVQHAPEVSLLFRKVGAATDSWERHKLKIMSIFFAKILQFDFVDAEFRKLVVDDSFAHWLMARRGYGVPYPEHGEVLFKAVKSALEDSEMETVDVRFNDWIPNSPFNADLLFADDRIAVLVLSKFSDLGNPVGCDLIQVELIKRLGWKVVPVDYRKISGQVVNEIVLRVNS